MRSNRIRELDGLRGAAAFVVLVHHILLTFPGFAAPYLSGSQTEDPWLYAATYTPLHLLWEGRAAVYIFFVLSGVVLTLPVVASGAAYSWSTYYPQRLARLYLPVWAAVVLAIVSVMLVPRVAEMDSAWLQMRSVEVTADRVLLDVTLLNGHGGLVSPLWSLRWEILFSLLLPGFVWVGVRLVRWRIAMVVASVAVIAAGATLDVPAAVYLPMFLLGVVIALSLSDIQRWGSRMGRTSAGLLVVAAPTLLVMPWLLRPLDVSGLSGVLTAVAASGAGLAVVAALTVPALKRLLRSRLLQWIGMISFSLYLVHEPIVISVAFLLGDAQLPLAAAVSLVASVVAGAVFYRVVERPSSLLARRLGSVVDRWRRNRAGSRRDAPT